jgi:hypothetical protein
MLLSGKENKVDKMKKGISAETPFDVVVGVDPDEAFGLSGPCFSNAPRFASGSR